MVLIHVDSVIKGLHESESPLLYLPTLLLPRLVGKKQFQWKSVPCNDLPIYVKCNMEKSSAFRLSTRLGPTFQMRSKDFFAEKRLFTLIDDAVFISATFASVQGRFKVTTQIYIVD